jgi:hypothetical protein
MLKYLGVKLNLSQTVLSWSVIGIITHASVIKGECFEGYFDVFNFAFTILPFSRDHFTHWNGRVDLVISVLALKLEYPLLFVNNLPFLATRKLPLHYY